MPRIYIRSGKLTWVNVNREVSELVWVHNGKREVIGSVEDSNDGFWWSWIPKKYWAEDFDIETEFYTKRDAKDRIEEWYGVSVKTSRKKKKTPKMHPFGL